MTDVLDLIPEKDDNKLLVLFHNAQDILSGRRKAPKEKVRKAQIVINAIEKEWQLRVQLAATGDYKGTLPDIGMLKTFGYTVGNNGEPKWHRKDLLRIVFESELPLVSSPAYTLEWGKPKTRKRFNKLQRTLWGLRAGKSYAENAVLDYTDDLEFIDDFKTAIV